ncbi:trypsin-like peptidase domain-containing protein [uncultured Piscinibacter sp.]|uniref:S1C family serine protease n=1 Tax=uncultured Piscinibacter sp. TaxID=1131835 RepID=UPI002610E9ED|nr:trypsin-like peptidase domain-containing protein [uncultured Piscinibacter sp.]
MKKAPLYSRSRRGVAATVAPPPEPATPPEAPSRRRRLRAFAGRHERRLWALAVLLLLAVALLWRVDPKPRAPLTFEQIDHLVRKSIEEKPLASAAALAYEKIIPSVVRVVGYDREGQAPHADKKADKKTGKEPKPAEDARPKREGGDLPGFEERGVGSGVVIVENGTILTNLHVVLGAERVRVTFMDGLEADAKLVNVMPEHDLAVLRASKIPDDLFPATMRSTGDLSPGDRVVAVGFPFGIGPSASEGVVSGLKREFRSPEGERMLTNLIQFDAAANPGNSGGPLVTMEGEVVGIVTAILNPTKQRVFVGIGFAVPIENAAAGAGMPPF